MLVRWACLLATITACSYTPSTGLDPDGAVVDGDGPAGDGPNTGPHCFGQFRTVCLDALPTLPFTLGGATSTVVTDVVSNCDPTATGTDVSACVLAGTSITIDGTLLAQGARPLVLIATEGPLVVTGLVDVSSLRGGARRGAGANPLGGCNGSSNAQGGGGGFGGSFGGKGGDGGDGANGSAGTAAAAIAFPDQLRGGCAGGLGGNPGSSLAGGSGGGAVWLISTAGIAIDGVVNASGAGGAGGDGDVIGVHGGAGGGSGGMVVLDAPTVAIGATGVVLATGGGGGGGNAGGFTGDDGANPDPADPDQPAAGGLGDLVFGGNGGLSNNGGDGDTNALGSGCGGGGGVGFVRAFGTLTNNGVAFPAVSMN